MKAEDFAAKSYREGRHYEREWLCYQSAKCVRKLPVDHSIDCAVLKLDQWLSKNKDDVIAQLASKRADDVPFPHAVWPEKVDDDEISAYCVLKRVAAVRPVVREDASRSADDVSADAARDSSKPAPVEHADGEADSKNASSDEEAATKDATEASKSTAANGSGNSDHAAANGDSKDHQKTTEAAENDAKAEVTAGAAVAEAAANGEESDAQKASKVALNGNVKTYLEAVPEAPHSEKAAANADAAVANGAEKKAVSPAAPLATEERSTDEPTNGAPDAKSAKTVESDEDETKVKVVAS